MYGSALHERAGQGLHSGYRSVEALEAESVELAATRLYLGECLVRLGADAEAGTLLRASYRTLAAHRGEDHPLTARAEAALEELRARAARGPTGPG